MNFYLALLTTLASLAAVKANASDCSMVCDGGTSSGGGSGGMSPAAYVQQPQTPMACNCATGSGFQQHPPMGGVGTGQFTTTPSMPMGVPSMPMGVAPSYPTMPMYPAVPMYPQPGGSAGETVMKPPVEEVVEAPPKPQKVTAKPKAKTTTPVCSVTTIENCEDVPAEEPEVETKYVTPPTPKYVQPHPQPIMVMPPPQPQMVMPVMPQPHPVQPMAPPVARPAPSKPSKVKQTPIVVHEKPVQVIQHHIIPQSAPQQAPQQAPQLGPQQAPQIGPQQAFQQSLQQAPQQAPQPGPQQQTPTGGALQGGQGGTCVCENMPQSQSGGSPTGEEMDCGDKTNQSLKACETSAHPSIVIGETQVPVAPQFQKQVTPSVEYSGGCDCYNE